MNKLFKNIKDNKELIAIGIFIIAAILIVGLQIDDQKKVIEEQKAAEFKITEEQKDQIVWENVKPGQTTYEEVKDQFNGFKERVVENNLIEYRYQDKENMDGQYREVIITADKNNTVQFIDLRIHPLKYADLSFYENKYNLGQPDIKMDIIDLDTYKAYVYLNKGLMLYVYEESDSKVITPKLVRNEIYFTPMSETQFMKLWGNDNLTEEFEAGADEHGGFNEPEVIETQ